MANNRIIYDWVPTQNAEFLGTVARRDAGEARILAMRNSFRALFPSPRFKVSGIAKWNGVNANTHGYGFILRDTDPSALCEFFFGFRTSSDNANRYFYDAFGGSSVTLGNYLKTISGTSVANSATRVDVRPFVWLNKSYATHNFAMGFADTTELTYTANADFQAPAISPFSNLATFLPNGFAGRTPGLSGENWDASNTYLGASFMYDTSLIFLRSDYVYGAESAEKLVTFSGKIFPTYAAGGLIDPDDTEQFGIAAPQLVSSGPSVLPSSSPAASPVRVFYTRANGTTVETLGSIINHLSPSFNRNTYTDPSSGEVLAHPCLTGTGAHTKGYIDPRILCEAYPFNDVGSFYKRMHYPDADNPMLREHALLCLAWYKDLPPPQHRPQAGLLLPFT
jgi:hypothetical protein